MNEILGDVENKKNGVFSYITSAMQEAESENQQGDDEDLFFGEEELERIDVLQVFNPSDVIKYIIVEDWFFDKRRSKMDVRIISITPVCQYDAETLDADGDLLVETVTSEAGTFFYPEIRKVLVNHKIYNEQNMMARVSFDEYFQRRLFSSHIVKESNVYDRDISEYIRQGDQLSQLLESERIKESIRTFEHNAWEY